MNYSIYIPSPVLDGIAMRARQSPSEEICGVVLRGKDIPMKNVASPPVARSRSFKMDPKEQLEIWGQWQKRGDLVVYHSHPKGLAHPSGEDRVVIARSPEITFLIFSAETGWFRAFRYIQDDIVGVTIDSTQDV